MMNSSNNTVAIVLLLVLSFQSINSTIIPLKLRKKLFLPAASLLCSFQLQQSVSYSADTQPIPPTESDNQLVRKAFTDFDQKKFADSEKEFTVSIKRWRELERPRDELVSLLKARANVLLDSKQFDKAIEDYDASLELMKYDGEDSQGIAKYPEYPDTFVGRALAKEGLADWKGALEDYNKAVTLWGGRANKIGDKLKKNEVINYEGVNPYVLTFRGNSLSRLDEYELAASDYKAASDIFSTLRDVARYSDARANYALTLYQLDRRNEAVKVMNDVIRKNPGYADMHVAIAADAWSRGEYIEALKEWRFTCDRIEVGCDAYKDLNWVGTIRRWPSSLTERLRLFLNREVPPSLKITPSGEKRAPALSST